jgi:hypothetical protein
MPLGEPQLASIRRLTLLSVFAAALWLFLVNPGTALADGDHSPNEWDSSSDHGSGSWQDEGSGPGHPCEEHGKPEEHPPVTPPETPPAPPETPETPPETPPAPPETPETPPETRRHLRRRRYHRKRLRRRRRSRRPRRRVLRRTTRPRTTPRRGSRRTTRRSPSPSRTCRIALPSTAAVCSSRWSSSRVAAESSLRLRPRTRCRSPAARPASSWCWVSCSWVSGSCCDG